MHCALKLIRLISVIRCFKNDGRINIDVTPYFYLIPVSAFQTMTISESSLEVTRMTMLPLIGFRFRYRHR